MRQAGSGCDFVHARGSDGHALGRALETPRSPLADEIVVMPADRPLVTADTLAKVVLARFRSGAALAFATARPRDFEGPRAAFAGCGRVRRDGDGRVLGIVGCGETRGGADAAHEVDVGYYCFRPDWLRANVAALAARASGAFDLSDLVAAAAVQGQEIRAVPIEDERECLSMKTPERTAPAERNRRHVRLG
jgi:bifunctional N-acetylglucosamine-1-phosphate-uridyltransferase/glucosamine-1-phosphate-acetyltransferase GlmU-like protein